VAVPYRPPRIGLSKARAGPQDSALVFGLLVASIHFAGENGCGVAIYALACVHHPQTSKSTPYMDKINATSFFQAWTSTVKSRKDHMLGIWRQAKPFTAYVKGNEESIMHEVSTKLGLMSYNEYYSLDTVLYEAEDLVPGRPEGSYWLRDIRVAVEHENYFTSGLYKEISHLLITHCDLRVLITYPDQEKVAELKYLHNVISGNRSAAQFSQNESILLIFGYESDFKWEGLVYKSDGWKTLTLE
jgi:hypothetical protein